MTRLLITGCNGLLGSNLVHRFIGSSDFHVMGSSLNPVSPALDIEFVAGDLGDADFAGYLIERSRPDLVINTVALVDIEKCEHDPLLARRVNVETAGNLARAITGKHIRLIHISTDHLFDGAKAFYTEEDKASPVNNYGQTKLEAEQTVLNAHENTAVIRTNFYGWCRGIHRPAFGEWMYRALRDEMPIKLFADYYYTPIDVDHLADALELVADSDFTGILNIAGSERCSKYDFGMAMAEAFDFSPMNVRPAQLAPDSFSVPRQPDLSLSIEKFTRVFGYRVPNLNSSLERFKQTKPVAML